MADEEECTCPEPEPGIPKWMPTFADLMTLLMCFFVLLLSFAEMDVVKFKKLAAAMSNAFGVQTQVQSSNMPMGTSVIAQHFSPGRPQPTPISEIYQQQDQSPDVTLDVNQFEREGSDPTQDDHQVAEQSLEAAREAAKKNIEELIENTRADAAELAQDLQKQIARGEVEIETVGRKIIIRIREKGSFQSGSAELAREYRSLMGQISDQLVEKPGSIQVQGHTDNIPIATERFRSNWELSSARAVSVAHELLLTRKLDPNRFTVSGMADTKPLVDNEGSENRARNRRVEIVIHQGYDDEASQDLEAVKDYDPVFFESLGLGPGDVLLPGEVF